MKWNKDEWIKALSEKATESIQTAVNEIKTIGKIPNKKNETHILNAEYGLAQYHAYMELLSELDTEEYLKCAALGTEYGDYILKGIQRIYSWTM